jgi:hypothetical protein
VNLASPRAFLVIAAAYYPALTLLVAGGSWAVGKPVDGLTVLTFMAVTALAGALVGSALRRHVTAAKGAMVVLVAILELVLLTPLVLLPDLLFGLSGLTPRLDFQQSVIALLVVTLAVSLVPVFWIVGSCHVLLLRAAARRASPV